MRRGGAARQLHSRHVVQLVGGWSDGLQSAPGSACPSAYII